MTKEDIAEILCMVGTAILNKSKEKEEQVADTTDSSLNESGSFDGDFDGSTNIEESQTQSTPVTTSQPVMQQPIIQQPNMNNIFTPASVPVEIQNMLQQKESQIANLQSQLAAVQTSNLGFTPIKL